MEAEEAEKLVQRCTFKSIAQQLENGRNWLRASQTYPEYAKGEKSGESVGSDKKDARDSMVSESFGQSLERMAATSSSEFRTCHQDFTTFIPPLSEHPLRSALVKGFMKYCVKQRELMPNHSECMLMALCQLLCEVLLILKSEDDLTDLVALIFDLLYHHSLPLNAKASSICCLILGNLGLTAVDFRTLYAETIGSAVCRRLLAAESNSQRLAVLTRCAVVVNTRSQEHGLLRDMSVPPVIIKHLICTGTDHARHNLEYLAKLSDPKGTTFLLIKYWLPELLPLLIVDLEKPVLQRAIKNVELFMGQKLSKVGFSAKSETCSRILGYLSDEKRTSRVEYGIRFMANLSGEELKTDEEDMEDYVQYIKPRFFAYIHFVDKYLSTDPVYAAPSVSRKRILRSFAKLIRFLKAVHISPFRIKLLSTLETITATHKDTPSVLKACFQCWDAFMRTLDDGSLKAVLSHVVFVLLPYVRGYPKEIVPIFEYLIVEKYNKVVEHCPELFFVPDLPAIHHIYQRLSTFRSKVDVDKHFKVHLEQTVVLVDVADSGYGIAKTVSLTAPVDVRKLRYPQPAVKQLSLQKLRDLLRDHQGAFHELVNVNERSSPAGVPSVETQVSDLVSLVMNDCTEAHSDEARRHFAEVIGCIGAIDPDRVEFPKQFREKTLVFVDVSSRGFAKNFLKELVKGYMTSKGEITDAYSVVIQESLKFFGLNALKSHELIHNDVWKDFGSDYHDVLRPFLQSTYGIADPTANRACDYPILDFDKSQSYMDWLKIWTTTMISQLIGNKNIPVQLGHFLHCCRNLLEFDPMMSLTLLPYVFLLLLLHGTVEDVQNLKLEMDTVFKSNLYPQMYSMDLRYVGTQTMLTILDFLGAWLRLPDAVDIDQRVGDFVMSVSDNVLAQAALFCGATAKALMHFERSLRNEDQTFDEWNSDAEKVTFLQNIYVSMDETDGITGLSAKRLTELLLDDKIILHRCTGDIREAQTCLEQVIQQRANDADQTKYHCDILRCYLDLEQTKSAIAYCNGKLFEHLEWVDDINNYRVEAVWKLGQWSALEEYLSAEENQDTPEWNVGVGGLLLTARAKDSEAFRNLIGDLRSKLAKPICAITNTEKMPFHHAFDHILSLHTLQEIEDGAATWMGIEPYGTGAYQVKSPEKLLSEWKTRLDLARPTYPTIQKILHVRRAILQAVNSPDLNGEIGKCWLQSAQCARKSHRLQAAYMILMNASQYNFLEFPVEQAKHLKLAANIEGAIEVLETAATDERWRDPAKRIDFAKMKLLQARYLEESKRLQADQTAQCYLEVVKLAPNIEKSHFFLGRFYDKMLEASRGSSAGSLRKDGAQIVKIVEQFAESLRYGCRFIHQSLPRMLGLWLDFGGIVTSDDRSQLPDLQRVNAIMTKTIKQVPTYVFLTAFPQLISRIGNPNDEVFKVLATLIAQIIKEYPRQAMWNMSILKLSDHKLRKDRYKQILEKAISGKPDLKDFVTRMEDLCRILVKICSWSVEQDKTKDGVAKFPDPDMEKLRILLGKKGGLRPILPFWDNMNPQLPTMGDLKEHKAFDESLSEIMEIEQKFEVLASMQKPKRVTIVQSNGKKHGILLKHEDDLRKDARCMDLMQLINQFLNKDPECRRRDLHLKTYSVIPLNDANGIIEWVPNVDTLRKLMIGVNTALGRKSKLPDHMQQKHQTLKNAPIDVLLACFREMCQTIKPTFHRWFEMNYSDPALWLKARMNYTRTMAVLSIVGYIMGLGDRHSENILLDKTTAEAFNIDFGQLFNTNLELQWPETVPFRLTRNVVHGFGPLGVEGIFRKACEMTLQIVMDNKNATMNVLSTFLHDPLLEWDKSRKKDGHRISGKNTDRSNESQSVATMRLKHVEQRLSGQISMAADTLPLSVSGHVEHLIKEATSETNLCKMWIGWGACL